MAGKTYSKGKFSFLQIGGGGENQQPMQLLRQNSLVVKAVMFFHYEQPFSCVEAACHTTGSD